MNLISKLLKTYQAHVSLAFWNTRSWW